MTYFCAEYSGEILYRILHQTICDKKSKGSQKNILFNEIPFSKWFGYFATHIFEAKRRNLNVNTRFNETMIDFFKKNPLEWLAVYKDNYPYEQGEPANISDFNLKTGEGYGVKPSHITHKFHKQIIFICRFLNEDKISFMKELKHVWNRSPIYLKNTLQTNKQSVENLNDFDFDFDPTKAYYIYEDFKKTRCQRLGINRMSYMCDYQDLTKSILVENLKKEYMDSIMDKKDFIDNIDFHYTDDILKEE